MQPGIYVFDGTLGGILTAVFEWFERKPGKVVLCTKQHYVPSMFGDPLFVITDAEKASRVWNGIVKKASKSTQRKLYCCALAETPEAFDHLFTFCCYLFTSNQNIEDDYGHPAVLGVAQIARSVEREKHRMEAFIRFKKASDGMFIAQIDPDFNVLPLISKHFKDRYADQQWLIFDLKRKYGLFYDLKAVCTVTAPPLSNEVGLPASGLDFQEDLYAHLWKGYFKYTNIAARKNTALHVKHVPKRYWKYLTEKQL